MTAPRQLVTSVHLANPAFTVVVTVAHHDGPTSPAPGIASPERSSAPEPAPRNSTIRRFAGE